jgi:Tol biopolymer transport system component
MIRLYLCVASIVFVVWMTGCSASPRTEEYKIAMVASNIKQPGIMVMKSDASEKKLLLSDPSARLLSASWSPDGNKIAFFSNRPADLDILSKYQIAYHSLLYEIDRASGKNKRLLDIPVSGFQWSPDGKRILFISSYEDPDKTKGAVYIMNLHTGEQKRVTSLGQACFAIWSPDGTQLAYSMGNDKSSDVYTVSCDGKSVRCLTDSKSVYTKPAWSPDGKTIAYIAMNLFGQKDADAGIYGVDPHGANRRLISGIMASSVLWSPDGKSLLVQWSGGASLIDAEGKRKSTTLASEVEYLQDLVFAPDGKKIVFRSKHDGDWHIYSEDIDGRRFKKLSDLSVSTFCLSPALVK